MEEKVLYAVTVTKPKSFGRWDTYSLVLTDQRIIIAQITKKMAEEAADQANRDGKAAGKGFFARWDDQLKALFSYSQRYLSMEPEKILKETKDNFAINIADVKKIGLERVQKAIVSGVERVTSAQITIETKRHEFSYQVGKYAEDLQAAFSQVLGDRVSIVE